MPAPSTLSPRALTIGFVSASVITLGILTYCTIKFGHPKEKPLPVEVVCGKFPIPIPGGGAAVISDAVKLRNLSDSPIPHLAIQVNKRFFYNCETPLSASAEIVIPLVDFKTKAIQPFRPEDGEVYLVTVFGQLPNRSRGVMDYRPR